MSNLQLGLVLTFGAMTILGIPVGLNLRKTERHPTDFVRVPPVIAIPAIFSYCVGAVMIFVTGMPSHSGPLLHQTIAFVALAMVFGMLMTMVIGGLWAGFFDMLERPFNRLQAKIRGR